MKRANLMILFILIFSMTFNIKAQDYIVYEYYELTKGGNGERGSNNLFSGSPVRYYYEYTFLYSDLTLLNNFNEMKATINIFNIKPENHTNDYFQAVGNGNNGYKLEYNNNGKYKKFNAYFRYNQGTENRYVYRKRIFNNENEYNNYLITIMDINPLPIELLYFKARYDNEKIIVEWSTGSENNNDYFNIEVSYDGYLWNDILRIEGQGNTSIQSNYKYDISIHKMNYDQVEPIYVRLKQTDYDGNYEVFETQSLYVYYEKPIYVYYNLEGKVYDNENEIEPNTIYIKKELRTGETIKIIKQYTYI